MYEVFLDVYSNVASNENLIFQIWNAAEAKTHVDVTPTAVFLRDQLLGMPSKPQLFSATNTIDISIPLTKGWNWLSFNVLSDQLTSSDKLLGALNCEDGDIIKTLGKFDQYGTNTKWLGGGITGSGGFNPKESYRLKLSNVDTLQLVGTTLKSNNYPIDLVQGWNWIGFVSQKNIDVNSALNSFNPTNGDIVKGQKSFAFYDQYMGWIGSLKYLEPTQGYMLKIASAKETLIYPNDALFRKSQARINASETPWTVASGYEKNMSAIIKVTNCNNSLSEKNLMLGAFVGNECRGYIDAQYLLSLIHI